MIQVSSWPCRRSSRLLAKGARSIAAGRRKPLPGRTARERRGRSRNGSDVCRRRSCSRAAPGSPVAQRAGFQLTPQMGASVSVTRSWAKTDLEGVHRDRSRKVLGGVFYFVKPQIAVSGLAWAHDRHDRRERRWHEHRYWRDVPVGSSSANTGKAQDAPLNARDVDARTLCAR